jgi:hypothetical protein
VKLSSQHLRDSQVAPADQIKDNNLLCAAAKHISLILNAIQMACAVRTSKASIVIRNQGWHITVPPILILTIQLEFSGRRSVLKVFVSELPLEDL